MELEQSEAKISEYQFKRTGWVKMIVLTNRRISIEYSNKKWESYPLEEIKAVLIDRPLWSYWFLIMGIIFCAVGVLGLSEAKFDAAFFLLLGGIGLLSWKGSTRLFIRLAGRRVKHVIKGQDIKLIGDFIDAVRRTLTS